MDAVSFVLLLFNIAVTGTAGLFFTPAPLAMKQGYLVLVGVVTAYIFTFIPEWTAWMLLAAMAVYDIFAVLVPGGPLRLLVETAQERGQVSCPLIMIFGICSACRYVYARTSIGHRTVH